MKGHIIRFIVLIFLGVGTAIGGFIAGNSFAANTTSMNSQIRRLDTNFASLRSRQIELQREAAQGQTYRDYKQAWDARLKEYNTANKVVEILNAEASRAGINPPKVEPQSAGDSVFNLTTIGRLNDLLKWSAAIENRIDLLSIDDATISSQTDNLVSLRIRARVIGGLDNGKGTPIPTANTR